MHFLLPIVLWGPKEIGAMICVALGGRENDHFVHFLVMEEVQNLQEGKRERVMSKCAVRCVCVCVCIHSITQK